MIVRQPQAQVIATAEGQGLTTASIGPTSRKGWTTLWSEEVEESDRADYGAQYLAIDETPDGLQLDALLGSGVALRQVWPYASGTPMVQNDAMAGALAGLFDCRDRQQDVEELLRGEPWDPEELVESLVVLLDLPELYEPIPAVSVVAFRGEHKIARFAATIAGPALLCAAPDGWSILLASGEDETRSVQLAAGLSGAARRRDLVLEVWRDGTGSGWSLWRRGRSVAEWSWNTSWCFLKSDPVGAEALTVQRLVKALGHPVDEDSLRVLLRSKRQDLDPLAELVALLGLPMDLLVALDHPERFAERAGVKDIDKTSARRAVLQGARGDFDADALPRWPALSIAYAVGTAVAAAICVAMTGLMIAVLVTHGAVTEQAGTSREDWVYLAVFGALSLILIPTGVFRIRRLRRWRRP
jgi:hypothetical protein